MIRRFLLIALLLHAAFALTWGLLSPHSRDVYERWSVTVCASVLTVNYAILVVAYWRAQKTRLNSALAINKLYLGLLFGLLTLPALWGILLRDAPYNRAPNPYSYWVAWPWLRVYLYDFLALSTFGVLFEFTRINRWLGLGDPPPTGDRRKRPYGRRRTDQPPPDPPSWLQSTDVVTGEGWKG